MSLLGGYRRKPGGEGYEALQLVEGGGGGCEAGEPGAGGRSPSRQPPQQQQQQQQKGADGTMDSSGRAGGTSGPCVWGEQWHREGGNNGPAGTMAARTMAALCPASRSLPTHHHHHPPCGCGVGEGALKAVVGWVREP